ncbi:uncharacterized protein LOC126092757 [Schistocerca cancellata]|uniref:uncharacterized protein LOC126092757 n=1 Tax=Schistocerca cancellata TaxID=274614 RepID=UPI00211830EA|nr:uncharacterized protein LOC126092757 [Schistocerca cancellata]
MDGKLEEQIKRAALGGVYNPLEICLRGSESRSALPRHAGALQGGSSAGNRWRRARHGAAGAAARAALGRRPVLCVSRWREHRPWSSPCRAPHSERLNRARPQEAASAASEPPSFRVAYYPLCACARRVPPTGGDAAECVRHRTGDASAAACAALVAEGDLDAGTLDLTSAARINPVPSVAGELHRRMKDCGTSSLTSSWCGEYPQYTHVFVTCFRFSLYVQSLYL